MGEGADKLSKMDYFRWHLEHLHEDLNADNVRRSFQANATVLYTTANSHPVIGAFLSQLQIEASRGRIPADLNGRTAEVLLKQKSYDSVVDKIYRMNCAWNRQWGEAPRGGWVTAENCYSRIDDMVRAIVVCRYIDVPGELAQTFKEIAEDHGLTARHSARALTHGYYAWHYYLRLSADIFPSGTIQTVPFDVEIQFTTLLQFTLRELTHQFYEQRRSDTRTELDNRWRFGSPEFRGTYLSHTLHLVDDMILDLRKATRVNHVDHMVEEVEDSSEPGLNSINNDVLAKPARAKSEPQYTQLGGEQPATATSSLEKDA